jgi:hypothetical protein
MSRELPPCPAFGGRTNPPPTSMDLALLDAVLEGRPYSRVGAYLYHLRLQTQQGNRSYRHEPT